MSLNNKIYIIAEIGINHNGSLEIAKQLIDIAKVAGCDVVKFQKRNPDVCVPEHQKTVMRDTPWGKMSYLDYKYKVEFNKSDYDNALDFFKEGDSLEAVRSINKFLGLNPDSKEGYILSAFINT